MGEGLGKGGVSGRAGAEAKAMAPSLRFSQLFPWPAAERTQGGRVRGGGGVKRKQGNTVSRL